MQHAYTRLRKRLFQRVQSAISPQILGPAGMKRNIIYCYYSVLHCQARVGKFLWKKF